MAENHIVALTQSLSEEELRLKAWLGDAVLGLFVRRKIAESHGKIDTPAFIEATSNQFLSSMGSPTRVEAQIGVIYSKEGHSAAEAFLEAEIWPRALRQITRKGAKR